MEIVYINDHIQVLSLPSYGLTQITILFRDYSN
jgi:hypothetical protein